MCDETVTVGVLALQGAFREHRKALEELGVTVREIRLPKHLEGLSGIVMPGGESTTIGKLLIEWKLMKPLADLGQSGFPIWGTCAGAILMAERVLERGNALEQPLLKLLPMTAIRNAFGRQRESFETDLSISGLEGPFRAVFIRAPLMEPDDNRIDVLADVDGDAVFVRSGNLMATSFHPELTDDRSVHRYFLGMVDDYRRGTRGEK